MPKHAEATVSRAGDAAALLRKPTTDRPYLVQLGPNRWIVRGGSPGCNDESLLRAFAAIVDCLRGRPKARTDFRVNRRSVRRRSRHTPNPSSASRATRLVTEERWA